MLRELLAFLYAVGVHAVRAMLFRADGTGLPKKPGGSFFAILALATAMVIVRYSIIGDAAPDGVVISNLLTVMLFAMCFGEKRFPCLGLYLCLSIGIDLVAMVAKGVGLLDVEGVGLAFLLWEAAGLINGFYKFDQKLNRKRAS